MTSSTDNVKSEVDRMGGSSRARFIRDSSLFSMTLVLGGISRLLRSYFIAKLLGPQHFGTWRFVNIFSDYVHLASLGTLPAIRRIVPFLRGKGEFNAIEAVLKTACAITFFCSVMYTGIVFTWSFFLTDPATADALALFSPVVFLLAWMKHVQDCSLATALYSLRRHLETTEMLLSLVFCVLLANLWGLYGATAGLAISALITVVISARYLWQYFAFTIEWRILRDLIVTGIPILADTVLMITMANSDRVLIAATLNSEALGIYSVSAAGIGILGTIPAALGQMLFVKFAELDGLNKTKEHIANVLDRTTIILSSLFAPVLCVAIAIFPIAVVFLLPEYVGGIGAGKISIAAIFFLGVSLPATKWCVSTGRFVTVLTLRVVVVVAELLSLYFVIQRGASFELIALCVVSSFFIFHCAIIIACSQHLEQPLRQGVIAAIKSLVPFSSVLACLWVQYQIYPTNVYTAEPRMLMSCVLGLGASLAISTPFLIWANRKTRVVELILNRSTSLVLAKTIH